MNTLENQKKPRHWIYQIAIVIAVFLVLSLFYRPLFFLVLVLVGLLAFGGGLFLFFRQLYTYRQQGRRKHSTEGIISRQLSLCGSEIDKNKQEIKEIEGSISELETELSRSDELITPNWKSSQRILDGFKNEKELRLAKIDFYKTCQSKLETLQYNHDFAKRLEDKQDKLNKLKEAHHEDLAAMESLRTELEYNKQYLETIEVLSLRMLEINTLDSAQQLQKELKTITGEIRKL